MKTWADIFIINNNNIKKNIWRQFAFVGFFQTSIVYEFYWESLYAFSRTFCLFSPDVALFIGQFVELSIVVSGNNSWSPPGGARHTADGQPSSYRLQDADWRAEG